MPVLHTDSDAQDAADDQRRRHQDGDNHRTLQRLVHQQEAAYHVKNPHEQMKREPAPFAVHEGMHDLEHARHQQQRTNEDDAGNGEGDDIEPGDDAQHKLGDPEGNEPSPSSAGTGAASGSSHVAHAIDVNEVSGAVATRRLFHPGGARMRRP